MFHNILICPYSDYRNESVRLCGDPNQYHCLQNEHKQQGWLCIDPIWIEEDRCPEFNSRAQKLDSRVCKGWGCPGGIFRSNQVYKYTACHANSYNSTWVYTEPETSTLKTEETTSAGASDIPLYVGTTIGFIVLLLLVCFAVLVLKRRKKQRKDMEKDEEMKLFDVNTEKANTMYDKAKQCLYKDRFAVLVGTQGAGKTFVVEKLKKEWLDQWVKDDKRKNTGIVKVDCVNISEVTKRTGTRDRTLFTMDDVFKDLNTEMFVDFVIKELNSWYNMFNTSGTFYIVITVTRMLWQTFEKKFKKCRFFQRNIVDLGDINKEDRINILDYYIYHKTQSVVSRSSVEEGTDVTFMTQNIRECVTDEERKYNVIGYPAIIGVMCKNDRLLAEARLFVRTPVSWIKKDLNAIVNSEETDGYKCLVLSYMALCDGSLNLQRLDESLLQKIATLLNVEYTSPDNLMSALTSLEKEYIKNVKETYVFENNVVHMLIFAIIGEKWRDFVTKNCSIGMLLDWTCIVEFPSQLETDCRKLYFKQPDLSVLGRRYAALPEEEIKFNHNLKNMNFKEMLEKERSKKTSTQKDE